MNLRSILNEKQRRLLKIKGIIFHDKMSEEEMEQFEKELWSTNIPIEIIKDILNTIDEATN